MAEGDTIHRTARRLNAALGGREIALAESPDPRSPVHRRAGELRGRTLERAEARGKHLLAHFSGGVVLHSHLGINGGWRVRGDGRIPYGKPWVLIGSGPAVAAQFGGKLLRLVSESRARNDPGLMQLGPDPLAPGFDAPSAARRLLDAGTGREVGDALLDQRVIAGIGNAIRVEALFRAGVDPWRHVDDLEPHEAESLVRESEGIMRTSLARGRRPRSIYRAARRGCPSCGGEISIAGQGEGNRPTYWCRRCQS
jgi:endonuclease VIII